MLVVVGQSMQALTLGGLALFLPIIQQDLSLTYTEASALAASSTLVYAVMQIPAGLLADRFGPNRLFLIGLIGTSLMASSFAWLQEYPILIASQAVSGFFRALQFAPGLLLITSLFPSDRRATAMGVFVIGGVSSNLGLNLLGPTLVGPFGWRTLFLLFSLAGVGTWLLYRRYGPPRGSPANPTGTSIPDIVGLLRHRAMWVVGGIQFVRLAVVHGIGFWLPTLLVLEKGQTLQTAGMVVAFGALISAPANLVGGYLADRLRNPYLVICLSLTFLAATTLLLQFVDGLPLLLLVIGTNYFFIQFYFGPLFAVPIDKLGQSAAGLVTGFANFFANLGAVTAVVVLGAVRDTTGSFDTGLVLIASLCAFGVVLTLVLVRLKPSPAPSNNAYLPG